MLLPLPYSKRLRFYTSGQSLYEVVIALGIVSLILVAAIALSTTSIRNASFARNNSLATKFAQEGTEYLRQRRDTSWQTFRSQTGANQPLGSLNWPPGGNCSIPSAPTFCRRVSLSSPSADVVNTQVVVSWDDGQGTHMVRSATTFTRWK